MSEAKIRQPRLLGGRTRAVGGGGPQAAEDAGKRSKRLSSRGHAPLLAIGARPRADLLPAEVLVDRRERRVVRRLWAGVGVVAAVVAIGVGGASLAASGAATDLANAEGQTASLLQQQSQYTDVRTTEASTSLLEAGQEVGGSTEIAWGPYLRTVRASLPKGVVINGVSVDSASAIAPYAQSAIPLQGQRVATLTLDAVSTTLPSVPAWLDSVKALTGYVDATVNSVTLDDTGTRYTVNMTIHINEDAFDGKYDQKKGD
jgi:hypothetical protein